MYSFETLSPADFEELASDLIGKERRVRFETFGAGPDEGIDARYTKAGKQTILQAKHFAGSDFRHLLAAAKAEHRKMLKLAPKRYYFVTSQNLSVGQKRKIMEAFSGMIGESSQIYGRSELNKLLRKFPTVEKAHFKLWLSSTTVLERVLHAKTYNVSEITRSSISQKIKVYAPNDSLSDGQAILKQHNALIVSGPPGVGKTTLAQMLCYSLMANGWNLIAIREIKEGLSLLNDSEKQIFFFDDFLGRVALDKGYLSSNDADIVLFLKQIARSRNARFILTSRAYILEEARSLSDYLSEKIVDITKYVLDAGIYTSKVKAKILYNHLYANDVPARYIRALCDGDTLEKIIEHDHYNPRIIEWLTDRVRVGETSAESYPHAFLEALDHPHEIWDRAFVHHISKHAQHLLYCLFFSSEWGTTITRLRSTFSKIHPKLCRFFDIPFGPHDFDVALKSVEGSFVSIANGEVSFVNPSVRDYLAKKMEDHDLLGLFASNSVSMQFAEAVEQQAKKANLSKQELEFVTRQFGNFVGDLNSVPVWERMGDGSNDLYSNDLPHSRRLKELLRWWEESGDDRFRSAAVSILENPIGGWTPFQDATAVLSMLVDRLSANPDAHTDTICAALQNAVLTIAKSSPWPDEMLGLLELTDDNRGKLPRAVVTEIERASIECVETFCDYVGSIDSEAGLQDYLDSITAMSKRVVVDDVSLAATLSAIEFRMTTIRDEDDSRYDEDWFGRDERDSDRHSYSKEELTSLFSSLLD